MDLVVTCEFRFLQTPDGEVWTTSAFQYQFWQRYLEVFPHLTVVARIKPVAKAEPSWRKSSGDKVRFVALPYYVGFTGLLKNVLQIRKVLSHTCRRADAVIFRVPSQSVMLAKFANSKLNHYALEVVGDPFDVFAAGVTHSWLDKLLAFVSKFGLQKLAKSAVAACYVTEHYLQNNYPVARNKGAISVGCSDIELKQTDYAIAPRNYSQPATNIVFVGSLSQLYKGPDILLRAIAELREQGYQFQVNILGAGIYLEQMQTLAIALGVAEQIKFVGEVNHAQVNQYLDDADIFVMPSRTEGLPRALIEAMARALPCLATNVGGIPELLSEPFLFDSEDFTGFAQKLGQLSQDMVLLNEASRNNLERARHYENEVLRRRRHEFYQNYKIALEARGLS